MLRPPRWGDQSVEEALAAEKSCSEASLQVEDAALPTRSGRDTAEGRQPGSDLPSPAVRPHEGLSLARFNRKQQGQWSTGECGCPQYGGGVQTVWPGLAGAVPVDPAGGSETWVRQHSWEAEMSRGWSQCGLGSRSHRVLRKKLREQGRPWKAVFYCNKQ